MNMGFSLQQAPDLRLQQSCTVCDKSVHGKHDFGCPYGERLELIKQRGVQKPSIQNCPICHESRSIDVNHEDWLECSECNAQFATSSIAKEEVEDLEQAVLFDSKHPEGGYSVVILKEKGEGRFPYEEQFQKRLEQLETSIEQELKKKKAQN